jgi:hypothetical protein
MNASLRFWLHDDPELPSVWLSCDAGDGDPGSFRLALGATLTHRWPDCCADVADLLAERNPISTTLHAIVNDRADLGESVAVAVDDFQFDTWSSRREGRWARLVMVILGIELRRGTTVAEPPAADEHRFETAPQLLSHPEGHHFDLSRG